jgi:uracil-DNA glycosylase
MRYPWNLNYWKSGEWQVVNERLHDMERDHEGYNPDRKSLFRSLQLIKPEAVQAVLLGQDPYPDARYSTGVAFSIPKDIEAKDFPPTLNTLLQEYSTDCDYPLPSHGNLEQWSKMGVLLWNVIPSTATGKSLAHDWDEYSYLTREILTRLSTQGGIVFAFLGTVARRYIDCIDLTKNSVLVTSHPSPRGSINSRTPFIGSRIFTSINDHLVNMGREPINWRLDDDDLGKAPVQGPNLV